MNKVWIVAKREYANHVRRWSFWFLTIGLPFFLMLMGAVGFAIAMYAGSKFLNKSGDGPPRVLGIIDAAGLLDLDNLNGKDKKAENAKEQKYDVILNELNLPQEMLDNLRGVFGNAEKYIPKTEYRPFTDKKLAMAELEQASMRGLLVIPEDFGESYQAELWWYNETHRIGLGKIGRMIRGTLMKRFVDADKVSTLLDPLGDLEGQILNKQPEQEEEKKGRDFDMDLRIVLPLIFMVALMLIIFTSTGRLLQGLVEEKQNRVIELLLSSVTAEQLMAGKVIGLGLLGLTQLVIWLGVGFAPLAFLLVSLEISVMTILVLISYFILGYFLLAIGILGFGSVGNNLQESNQWTFIVIMPAMAPMFLLSLILAEPAGLVAQILTYFPLSAPLTGIFRFGAEAITWWELLLSMAILVLSILLTLRFSAKLFRLGILLTGKTPNLLGLWKLFRQA